jgi:hypothetical protein
VIRVRRVVTQEEIDAFLELRRAIDPEHMPSRRAHLEHIKAPGHRPARHAGRRADGLRRCGATQRERAWAHGVVSVRVLRRLSRRRSASTNPR